MGEDVIRPCQYAGCSCSLLFPTRTIRAIAFCRLWERRSKKWGTDGVLVSRTVHKTKTESISTVEVQTVRIRSARGSPGPIKAEF